MSAFDDSLICYKQLQLDHNGNVKFFLEKHSTKEGTWGKLRLMNGEIDFIFLDGGGVELKRYRINSDNPNVLIPPASWHKIVPVTEKFEASLEFYCKEHRYFSKKYKMNNVHSDLLYVYNNYLKKKNPLNILDVGCGSGRNLLYMALLKNQVTGIDINEAPMKKINEIAKDERLSVQTFVHDLNLPLKETKATYDFIISTVSLQFLEPTRVLALLNELQSITKPDGLHLLVFPIKASQFSLPASFRYLPEPNELYNYYQDSGWAILEYKESVGQLHRLDENGRPIQGLFAFLLAQKI